MPPPLTNNVTMLSADRALFCTIFLVNTEFPASSPEPPCFIVFFLNQVKTYSK